jgi:hypothetical protein
MHPMLAWCIVEFLSANIGQWSLSSATCQLLVVDMPTVYA